MKAALAEKIKAIKLVIFDVDGVLTDGRLWFTAEGQSMKAFHVHDGLGIKRLRQGGVEVAIITTCTSPAISKRMALLGVVHVFLGQEDKSIAFQQLLDKLSLDPSEVAYVGDDLPDLPVMQRVGFAVAVHNATETVKQQADYETRLGGGEGAAREICDMILSIQNT